MQAAAALAILVENALPSEEARCKPRVTQGPVVGKCAGLLLDARAGCMLELPYA
jgi:hypothetical protein